MTAQIDMKLLRSSRLFEGFSDSEFMNFCDMAALQAQNFEKKQPLVLQGDKIDRVAFVQSGTLFSEKSHIAWKSQLTHIYNPSDIALIEAYFSKSHTSPTSLIASVSATVVWIYGLHSILFHIKPSDMAMRNKLSENLLGIMAGSIIQISYRSNALSKYTVRGRILVYLSNLTERRNSATVHIGMTQEALANYLCVTRASLSVELHKMQAEGLIKYKGQTYTLLAFNENDSDTR